ncbi:hypothetical protein [Haloarchaeobius amylolyticus]|uniref:hypothetical protein n=1 Tax=Haloarchaeobius amylolyticus TaxID=1198296 RepID=UPI0022711E11|nr:hypothetical protein [Haloarchaeobius amylolyticus]
MAQGSDDGTEPRLGPRDRERLAAIRGCDSLADLRRLTGAADEHEAYFAAKDEWTTLRARELATREGSSGLPGTRVTVAGHDFHVHGITHAGTEAERAYLREHIAPAVEDGAVVYCEQGVRQLYFADLGVCEMDDYRWAMAECAARGLDSHADDLLPLTFDRVRAELQSLADRFRAATFELIHDHGGRDGADFRRALGDVASEFLLSHEDLGTGAGFEAFRKNRQAATDPTRLADLQRYYETAFLPQPLEREWLRRHDPELELVTHARNERMADYAVYHNEEATEVRLVVGAAHQPGVRYYLEQFRDGDRTVEGFELVE